MFRYLLLETVFEILVLRFTCMTQGVEYNTYSILRIYTKYDEVAHCAQAAPFKQSIRILNLKIRTIVVEPYCILLPELVGGKDTPISFDLLHSLEDVLALSELVLANQPSSGFDLLHLGQAGQPFICVRHIVANDGPLSNMHRR